MRDLYNMLYCMLTKSKFFVSDLKLFSEVKIFFDHCYITYIDLKAMPTK